MTIKLVVIEGLKYTHYLGRIKTITVTSFEPLNKYELQLFRLDPIKFVFGDNYEKL